MKKINLGAGYYKVESSADDKKQVNIMTEETLNKIETTIPTTSIVKEIIDTYERSKE